MNCVIMYHIDSSQTGKKSVIHITGRLDSKEGLEKFFREFFIKNGKSADDLIIDFSGAEMISTDCLEVLHRYHSENHFSFKNYSLYLELLLKETGLI